MPSNITRRVIPICLALALALAPFAPPALAGTIVEEWALAEAPPAPAVKSARLAPATTALLVLDLVRQGCNAQRRPRCVPTLAPVHTFLERSRTAGAAVVYSLVAGSTAADILPEVAAAPGEPAVTSGTDKFLNTNLDTILHDRAIRTVVIVGTAAHGAVLTTATEAALRGYDVVIAVDGISAESRYAEQLAVWTLLNAPVIASRVTLSRTDLIQY